MIRRTLGFATLAACLAATTLSAHHSLAGVYDMKGEKEITGAVEKVQFVNPHGSLTISVKGENGAATDWVFTLGSATALAQRGVGKTGPNALHAGDVIKVKYIPSKDGSPLGFLRAVTYPDGHTITVWGGGGNE
jgi:hypothetical protein